MNSMLDELPSPPDPKLYVCPCCKFSFSKVEGYIDHLQVMQARIEAALAAVKR